MTMTPDTGTYTLRRGEQSFGPYTIEEVAAYFSAGNVTSTDALFDHEGQVWTTASAVVARRGVSPGAIGGNAEAAQNPFGGFGGAQPAIAGAPGAARASAPVNGFAIASLVSGILSVTGGGFFLGILAIILASRAMKEPDRGGGMARAGLITGIIGSAIGVLLILGIFVGWVLPGLLN